MTSPGLNGRALRATAAIASAVVAVGFVVTGLRMLPWLRGDGVELAWLLEMMGAGLLMAAETAVFVAPPIGWALALSTFAERGELRALQALGVSPVRIVRSTVRALVATGLVGWTIATGWGSIARSPGELVTRMASDARQSCVDRAAETGVAVAVEVPVLEITWTCFPGGHAYAIGAPGTTADWLYRAAEIHVSADLEALELADGSVVSGPSGPSVRLDAARVRIAGIALPLSRSSLGPGLRGLIVAGTAIWLTWLGAAWGMTVLDGRRANPTRLGPRPILLSIAVLGAGAAVLSFASLEATPRSAWTYATIPAAGTAVALGVGAAFRGVLRGRGNRGF